MYKPPANEYQRAVEEFKRKFLLNMLAAHNGNRTHTARTLGLQRTYLLRLIRDFGLNVPPGRHSKESRAASADFKRIPCVTVSKSSSSR